MCFFKAPKITTQAITPDVTQALPASATAPTPEAPVFGAVDEDGEAETSTSKSKSGISSLKIKPTTVSNVAGANLQVGKVTGVKVS